MRSEIIEITDFNAPELDVFARKSEGQLLNRANPGEGLFIAESPKVVMRALDAGCKPVSLLMEKKHIETQGAKVLERCPDVPVYVAVDEVLVHLTGFALTRGMLCAMRRPRPLSVREACEGASRVAVLEDVMNPANVGAIFRNAAAMNMDAVLLSPACSNPLYRRAIRVSMGNVFAVPWAWLGQEQIRDETGDLQDHGGGRVCLDELHELGFRTAAMALREDTVSIDDERLRSEKKLAIVLGSEGEGLATGTIASCDYTVKIPMAAGVDSLNVAAASAIAFWELGRNR